MVANKTDHQFRGQRVLVVGLGVHGGGVATVRWLVKHGARVRVTDTKTRQELQTSIAQVAKLPITWHFGQPRTADFRWAQHIIVNPAVHPNLPELRRAEQRGVPVDNEASLFVRAFPGTLIGITGTRGKTTTTHLLGAILRRSHRATFMSGNVRAVPMLSYLDPSTPNDWAVLELSSYQLERLPVASRSFRVAVMTNLKIDHLNRHGSMAAYAATKYNLFRTQTPSDAAVLNYDDRWSRAVVRHTRAQVWWFSPSLPKNRDGITLRGRFIIEQRRGRAQRLCSLANWQLAGEHNQYNLLAAVAAARAMGVSATDLRYAVAHFSGVPHRQELIRTWRGHDFINDTTATSPDGTLAAFDVFPRGFYILGGTDKDLDLRPLAQALIRRKVSFVVLPGTATDRLVDRLHRDGYTQPIVRVRSMASAVQAALRLAQPKQTIVLSPGAASFGLFQHEFDRGDQFRRSVAALV